MTPNHGSRRARPGMTFVDQVYEHTREAILSGEYPPLMPLRLQELASANGVSLIPVREALRLLESEKLVESISNKGVRVAPLSTEDVRSAYEARIVLEVEALRLAYPKLTEQDLQAARRLANDMMDRFRSGDDAAGYELHRQLHFSLYDPCRSQWILYFVSLMWDHTERYRRMATEIGRDPDSIGHEHFAVIDALEQGDQPGALEALQAHLERTAQILIDAWSAAGEEPA